MRLSRLGKWVCIAWGAWWAAALAAAVMASPGAKTPASVPIMAMLALLLLLATAVWVVRGSLRWIGRQLRGA